MRCIVCEKDLEEKTPKRWKKARRWYCSDCSLEIILKEVEG